MKKVLAVIFAAVFACSLLLVTAAETNFTPSVTAKPAPEVVAPASEDDNVVATILINNGESDPDRLENVTVEQLSVTPLVNAEEAPEHVKAALEKAYKDLAEVENVGQLNEELNKKLDEIVKKIDKDLTVSDLIARDLFDIDLSEESMNALNSSEDAFLRVIFNIDIKPDVVCPVVIYRYSEDSEWKAVEPEHVKNNGNGTITVDFYELCPVVFLTTSEEYNAPVVDPDVPGTAAGNTAVYAVVAVVAVAAVAVAVVSKKRNPAD